MENSAMDIHSLGTLPYDSVPPLPHHDEGVHPAVEHQLPTSVHSEGLSSVNSTQSYLMKALEATASTMSASTEASAPGNASQDAGKIQNALQQLMSALLQALNQQSSTSGAGSSGTFSVGALFVGQTDANYNGGLASAVLALATALQSPGSANDSPLQGAYKTLVAAVTPVKADASTTPDLGHFLQNFAQQLKRVGAATSPNKGALVDTLV